MRDILYRSYLAEGETIQFVIHRHLFMQLKDFGRVFFFGIFLPLFGWWLFPEIGLFALVWGIVGAFRFIYEFFDWYYDVWLVTNVSIIEILWKGFFEKSSARIEYHIIQGIGYEVKGFWRTIFNYGMVALDKFTGNPSVFDGAVNPKKKSELLTAAQEQFVSNKSFRDHNALRGLLADMVQHHVTQFGVPQEEEEEVSE